MASFHSVEKQIYQDKNLKNIEAPNDQNIKKLIVTAAKHTKQRQWADTAVIYAALAMRFSENANYALVAARKYRLANAIDDSARWFLIAAERFAKQMQSVKAISAVRIFEQLKPDASSSNTAHILEMCKQSIRNEVSDYNNRASTTTTHHVSSMITDVDLFSAFGEEHVQELLESLTHRKLHRKEVLTKAGEPADCLYIVTNGSITAHVTGNNVRRDLGSIHNHAVFGIIGYFTGGGRSADSIAHGDAEVLELSYNKLDIFKANIPGFSQKLDALYENHLLCHHLAVSDVFANESLAIRKEVSEKIRPVYISEGQILFHEGDETRDVYLVRSGELAVSLSVKDSEHFNKVVVSGGFVGETAIATNNRRTATVRALTDCVLMKLDAIDYAAVYLESESLQNTIKEMRNIQANEAINIMKTVRLIKGGTYNEQLAAAYWERNQDPGSMI